MKNNITFIGFGEAAGAIVGGWGDATGIRAYDIKTDSPATASEMTARYESQGVTGCKSPAEAVAGADLVFCAVTADQAVIAAEACAPHMPKGAFWFDLNSCAPSSKRRAAKVMEAAGARYVDVAVMAPVYPKRNMVPLLIAGPHARAAHDALTGLPMAPRVVAGRPSPSSGTAQALSRAPVAMSKKCACPALLGTRWTVSPRVGGRRPSVRAMTLLPLFLSSPRRSGSSMSTFSAASVVP